MESMIEIGVDTLKVEGDPTKLYEELAKAQSEFLDVPRIDDGQVGNDRKFKYAGYATLMKCVRPALNKHGITILQPLHFRDGKAVTTTILAGHGASLSCSFAFNADYTKADKYGGKKDDCQEFGRAHTYYRRYQLQSILGIEGDEDADSIEAQRSRKEQAQEFAEPAPKKEEPKKEAKPAPAPKANGESAAKPVATASGQKTNGSAKASEPTTNGKVPSPQETVDAIAPEKLNSYLSAVMKQMDPPWKVIDIRKFYAEQFDAENEMPAPDAMDPALKRAILTKIIEVHKVAPF